MARVCPYVHIGQDWGVAESTICRTVQRVENTLIRSGKFKLPGKKHLLRNPNPPKTNVIDVTESPIERPKRHQKQFYSGKKKRHTLKAQLVVSRGSKFSVPLTAKLDDTISGSCGAVEWCCRSTPSDSAIRATKAGTSFMPMLVFPRRSQEGAV